MIKATINLNTIKQNLKTLKQYLEPGVKICAVLKANAYGLGDITVARAIENQVDMFAIAHINEATRLRTAGITKPILLLGICQDIKAATRLGLIISVNSINELKRLPKNCKIHIKVNTGMNRYGISHIQELEQIIKMSRENNIYIEGLLTHMAYETDNIPQIDKQLERFKPFRELFKTHFPHGIVHAAPAGAAHYKPAQFDMVRVGKCLYGGFDGYQTALTITAPIVTNQNLKPGDTVGYNATFTAPDHMRIGIVACGYADCTNIGFSNTGHVLVGKTPCKILGRICMDSFMIDITNVHGKTATIIAPKNGVQIMDHVKQTGVIACNILCSLNFNRAEVIYK